MSETPAPGNNTIPPDGENLGEEFRSLGKNLVGFLHAAWESPEGQQLKQDVEKSLAEISEALNKAADGFNKSEKGQQIKQDIDDLRQRVSNGELQSKTRQEMLAALRKVNDELTKAAERWKVNKAEEK